MTVPRYFTSIAGFLDSTLFVRVEMTGGEWDGVIVRRDGTTGQAALRGFDWILAHVNAGAWREIDRDEAAVLSSRLERSEARP